MGGDPAFADLTVFSGTAAESVSKARRAASGLREPVWRPYLGMMRAGRVLLEKCAGFALKHDAFRRCRRHRERSVAI